MFLGLCLCLSLSCYILIFLRKSSEVKPFWGLPTPPVRSVLLCFFECLVEATPCYVSLSMSCITWRFDVYLV